MTTSTSLFLQPGDLIGAYDAQGAPYISITTADYSHTLYIFLGDTGAPDERAAASAQLDQLDRAVDAARRLLARKVEPTPPGPDDPDDGDPDPVATSAADLLESVMDAIVTEAGLAPQVVPIEHSGRYPDVQWSADDPTALADVDRSARSGEPLDLADRSALTNLAELNAGNVDRATLDLWVGSTVYGVRAAAQNELDRRAVRPLDDAPETEAEARLAYGDR